MRWWGWGEDGHSVPLPPAAEGLLRDELGADPGVRKPPVALDQVALPDPGLPGAARERLATAVGADNVRDDRATRIAHAVGRSYPDLVRIRSGDASSAPDAVVLPESAEQVAAVLAACAEHRVAVVPFGGGTSVVGGVEPVRDGFAAAISLDLARLSATVEVDRTSLTARLDSGLFGPEAERRLHEQGVTLGHFPQSFEYSTVGGWVATRSAGQASTGYGRIDTLVEALRCVTPAGELGTKPVPASAAGPSVRELVVGSEGVLGVICEVDPLRAPGADGAPLRGLVVRELRRGLRRLPGDGAGRSRGRRQPALRRGRDAPDHGDRLLGQHGGEARPPLSAHARPRGRMHRDPRLRGRGGRGRGPAPPHRRAPAGRGRGGARPPARRGVAAQPLRRPVPARRADGPRRARRDARDGHELGEPRHAPRGGPRGARRRRSRAAARRRS